MNPTEIRSEKATREDAAAFLEKARQFYNGMQDALARDDKTQTCSSSVHCVISSCDAITAYFLGIKSTSQRHDDAAKLVRKSGAPGAIEKERQIAEVLSRKSAIEYGSDEPEDKQTQMLAKLAERIYFWAKDTLERAGGTRR